MQDSKNSATETTMDQDTKIVQDSARRWIVPGSMHWIILRWCWVNRDFGFRFTQEEEEELSKPYIPCEDFIKISRCLHMSKGLICKNIKDNPKVEPRDVFFSTVVGNINRCLTKATIRVEETKQPEEIKFMKNLLLTIDPSLFKEKRLKYDLDDTDIDFHLLKNEITSLNPIIVLGIARVVNAYLKTMYNLKRLHLKELYGKEPVEMVLYHGTHNNNIQQIYNTNFDHRLSGLKIGTQFGHGIYFSWEPMLAALASHCTDKMAPFQTMLCCKVLAEKTHLGNKETFVPKPGCDTTRSYDKHSFAKFDDDVFYPEYLIKFTFKEEL